MDDTDGSPVSRRNFLRAGGAAAGTAAVAGQATAQEEGGEEAEVEPTFGGYISGVDGGYEDLRGESEVTVEVGASGNGGAFAFSPAGIWVDTGTTVKWDWTGEGGSHNVVSEDDDDFGLNSGNPVDDSGVNYEFTFEEGGLARYFCSPHKSSGMLGAVAVGEDVETRQVGGGESALPDSMKLIGVAGTAAMASTLGLGYAFVKYGGAGRVPDE
jgi:halocyanin-like protein